MKRETFCNVLHFTQYTINCFECNKTALQSFENNNYNYLYNQIAIHFY